MGKEVLPGLHYNPYFPGEFPLVYGRRLCVGSHAFAVREGKLAHNIHGKSPPMHLQQAPGIVVGRADQRFIRGQRFVERLEQTTRAKTVVNMKS